MKTVFTFACIVSVLLLAVSCENSSTNLWSSILDIIVEPGYAKMQPGDKIVFRASGGNGYDYNWTVTSNAGIFEPGNNDALVFFTAGNNPGTYTLRVDSSIKFATATIEITDNSFLGISSAEPPFGSVIRLRKLTKPIAVNIIYSLIINEPSCFAAYLSFDGLTELTCGIKIQPLCMDKSSSGTAHQLIAIDKLCAGDPTITNYMIIKLYKQSNNAELKREVINAYYKIVY
jgi:hypothetical protein